MTSTAPAAICYLEIPAPEIGKMTEFYAKVFGWTVRQSHLSAQAYWEFGTGAGGLTGGFDSGLPVNPGGVLLYLKVSDIDQTLGLIRDSGGQVVRERFDIGGGYGFSALFTDPCGNRLGLFSFGARQVPSPG